MKWRELERKLKRHNCVFEIDNRNLVIYIRGQEPVVLVYFGEYTIVAKKYTNRAKFDRNLWRSRKYFETYSECLSWVAKQLGVRLEEVSGG